MCYRSVSVSRRARLARWMLALLLLVAAGGQAQDARKWKALEQDGIHDPNSPAVKFLQQPAEALSKLPSREAGDLVHWDRALAEGLIAPRSNIYPETKFNLRDTEIMLNQDGSMALVRFPHKEHTRWLDCVNCHEKLFKKKAGSNKYSMLAILEGEQCGICHGAVAFPLTECKRCHNTPRGARRAAASMRASIEGR